MSVESNFFSLLTCLLTISFQCILVCGCRLFGVYTCVALSFSSILLNENHIFMGYSFSFLSFFSPVVTPLIP